MGDNYRYNQNKAIAITNKLNKLVTIMARYGKYRTRGAYINDIVIKDVYQRAYALTDMPEDKYNEVMRLAKELQEDYQVISEQGLERMQKNAKKATAARLKKQARVRAKIEKIKEEARGGKSRV